MKEKTLFIISLFFINIFVSCSDGKEDFGNYIKGNYYDELVVVSKDSSIVIIIEQLQLIENLNESIPFSYLNKEQLSDTVKLNINVSFGSYNTKPEIFKEINSINDTIYVWYSTRGEKNYGLGKNNSINSISTSPKITYVNINSVVINKSDNKNVKLISRFIR